MAGESVEVVASRRRQSQASKRATFDQLFNKKKREKEISLILPGGGSEEVTLLFRAIGAKEYDKLVADCPPTMEQKAQGETYDANKFAPTLISHTAVEPELTVDQAMEIWSSPDWSRGEVMTLYMAALDVCSAGFDVPPTANG